jgi:hypothetical protein
MDAEVPRASPTNCGQKKKNLSWWIPNVLFIHCDVTPSGWAAFRITRQLINLPKIYCTIKINLSRGVTGDPQSLSVNSSRSLKLRDSPQNFCNWKYSRSYGECTVTQFNNSEQFISRYLWGMQNTIFLLLNLLWITIFVRFEARNLENGQELEWEVPTTKENCSKCPMWNVSLYCRMW